MSVEEAFAQVAKRLNEVSSPSHMSKREYVRLLDRICEDVESRLESARKQAELEAEEDPE